MFIFAGMGMMLMMFAILLAILFPRFMRGVIIVGMLLLLYTCGTVINSIDHSSGQQEAGATVPDPDPAPTPRPNSESAHHRFIMDCLNSHAVSQPPPGDCERQWDRSHL